MKKLFSLILLLSFSIKAQDVKIGTQTWTTKNLNVTNYRNGDAIPQVQDKNAWANLTTGAWCYYENKEENGITYGKLYNFYAVIDPRGIAPEGYHIPTKKEWNKLADYLYLDDHFSFGTKMKSTSGWQKDGNGSNTSGFDGLPGGCLTANGLFGQVGDQGSWWSSSEVTIGFGGYLSLKNYSPFAFTQDIDKHFGLSVRCLRD